MPNMMISFFQRACALMCAAAFIQRGEQRKRATAPPQHQCRCIFSSLRLKHPHFNSTRAHQLVTFCNTHTTTMPPTTRRARAEWAFSHVFALPEIWAIVAEHSGVVGAWRLTGVCQASRVGAKEWLRNLPGLVVCGGVTTSGRSMTSEVWRLDLGELRWERMPSLTRVRQGHACCTVRGGVVVLGGAVEGQQEGTYERTASVEILGCDSEAGGILPPLSCGPVACSAAVAIDESQSDHG